MIETVVNLNGVEEKFDAKKLNHWVKDSLTGKLKSQWAEIAVDLAKNMPAKVTVPQLLGGLVDRLLAGASWSHYMVAGRVSAMLMRMEIYGSKTPPTVREVQHRLHKDNLMRALDYSDYEWSVIEKTIEHDLDFTVPHFALEQIRKKYSLQDFHSKKEYETQQFVYMRMAMAIFEAHPETHPEYPLEHADPVKRSRLEHVIRIYRHFSKKRLSAPTPNYNNMGTYHRGYASCCVVASDDNRFSLAAADHITYMMTTQSAGQGLNEMTRSLGDPVQKGRFLHRGKKPYIDAFGKNINANLQGGRGGAGTFYANLMDPESKLIFGLRDTRATDEKRNRDAHYAFMTNRFMLQLALKGKQVFAWNCYTAPTLHELFYGDDVKAFAAEYERLEADPTFHKQYFDAREVYMHPLTQGVQTGTIYAASIDEMNINTPFISPIRSSNLCTEVSEPTEAYTGRDAMKDLYSSVEVGFARFDAIDSLGRTTAYNMKATDVVKRVKADGTLKRMDLQDIKEGYQFVFLGAEDKLHTVTKIKEIKREPEVALCSLGAANVTEEMSDEEYRDVMYYGYKMIDYAILENDYILPHMGVTAKQRMNAGMGLMGVATHMARRKLKYNSKEGLQELHRVFERHMYFAIEASLTISRERGNAPWIDRTKWPDGWNTLQNYRREIDKVADFTYYYDHEEQRERVKANGGLAHSTLVNFMPGESSSKALGAVNSYYGIRQPVMIKIDATNVLRWAAPYSDDPAYEYHSMWDTTLIEQNSMHGIAQKWCDQAPSADWWLNFTKKLTIGSTELLEAERDRIVKGIKTRYYINTLMPADEDSMKIKGSAVDNNADKCGAGQWNPEAVKDYGGQPIHDAQAALSDAAQAELVAAGITFQSEGGDGHAECAGCST